MSSASFQPPHPHPPTTFAETEVDVCAEQTRRTLPARCARHHRRALAVPRRSTPARIRPAPMRRPQKGDLLVFSEGDQEGKPVTSADLPRGGGPPVHAWPKDPKDIGWCVVASRLNEILIIRLDPRRTRRAGRARVAIRWDHRLFRQSVSHCRLSPSPPGVKSDVGDKEVFKCMCHNSEYDPPRGARRVVFGPAPRRPRRWAAAGAR